MSGANVDGEVLAGPRRVTTVGHVLTSVAQRVQDQLGKLLVEDLPSRRPDERPTAVLSFVHSTRQQLLRLAALLNDTRKLAASQQLQNDDNVLNKCANHTRALQQAADELFTANLNLKTNRAPLFHVQTALDVLASGTYRGLPQKVEEYQGIRPLPPLQQRRLVQQLNHLLYVHLLKAALLPQLQLVQVSGGTAVLRCQGLYEVKLSLQQRPYPQEVLDARKAAKQRRMEQVQQQQREAEHAGGRRQQQEGQQAAAAEPLSVAPAAGTDVVMEELQQQQEHQDGQQGAASEARGADEDEGPAIRWQWALIDAVMLPNAGERPPLRPPQLAQLLWEVRVRMAAAADAAAMEAAKAAPAAAAAAAGEGAVGADKAAVSGPAASGATSAPSTVTGLSRLSGGAPLQAVGQGTKRGLGLEQCRADENAAPLREMHGLLRDVAVQLLLEGARAAAQALVAPGSKWHRQVQVQRSQVLKPGLRVVYWTSADVVLLEEGSEGDQQQQQRQAPAGAGRPPSRFAAGAGRGGGGGGPSSSGRGREEAWRKLVPKPAVEIGVGDDGLVQVLHVPPLSTAEAGGAGDGAAAPARLQLQLNTHRVDVEALLLQSARVLANRQLRVLLGQLQQQLQLKGLAEACQLRLLQPSQPLGTEGAAAGQPVPPSSAQQQEQQQVLPGATGERSEQAMEVLVQPQQQQEKVLRPLLVPDVLDICIGGSSMIRVTYRAWSGQLVVRPGASQGGDRNLGAVAQHLQDETEILRKQQGEMEKHLVTLRASPVAAATAALTAVAMLISEDAARLHNEQVLSALLSAAYHLSLHFTHHFQWLGRSPRPPQQQQQQHMLKARHVYLSFPTVGMSPWLGQVPLPPALAGEAPTNQQPQRQSACCALSFVLCTQFPPMQERRRYWLLVSACNIQGLPGPVFKRVIVPSRCYILPGAQQAAAAAGDPSSSTDQPKASAAAGEPSSSTDQLKAAAAGMPSSSAARPEAAAAVLMPSSSAARPEAAAAGGMPSSSADRPVAAAAAVGGPASGRGGAAAAGTEEAGGTAATQGWNSSQGQAAGGAAGGGTSGEGYKTAPGGGASGGTGWGGYGSRSVSTALELPGVVAWCQVRMTYERLLVELQALQLPYIESMQAPAASAAAPAAAAASAAVAGSAEAVSSRRGRGSGGGCWQQPVVYLQDAPGLDLYQQLVRRSGLEPSRVGLKEVSFTIEQNPGEWAMRLRGSFLEPSSSNSTCSSSSSSREPQAGRAAAAAFGEVTSYRFNFARGEDVRGALLLLRQMLHLQRFLLELESLALGVQALTLAQNGREARPAQKAALAAVPALAGSAGGTKCEAVVLPLSSNGPTNALLAQGARDGQGTLADSNAGAANAPKAALSRKRGSSVLLENDVQMREPLQQDQKDLYQGGLGGNGTPGYGVDEEHLQPSAKRVKLGVQQQQQQDGKGEKQHHQQQPANGWRQEQLPNGPLSVSSHHHHEQQQQQEGQQQLGGGGPGLAKENGVAASHAPGQGEQLPRSISIGTKAANGSNPAGVFPSLGEVCRLDSSSSSNASRRSKLLWHWEGTGLIRLVEVSATHAVLACGPPLQQQSRSTWPAGSSCKAAIAGPAVGKLSSRAAQEVCFTFSWRLTCAVDDAVGAGVGMVGESHAPAKAAAAGVAFATTIGSRGGKRWLEPSQLLKLRCRVTADVPVPVEVLEELGEMVDSGEEGRLLDALAVVAWPLAAVARLMQQQSQQEMELSGAAPAGAANSVGAVGGFRMSLVMRDSPYHLRLLLLQNPSQQQKEQQQQQVGTRPGFLGQHVVGLSMASHGRVSLCFLPASNNWQQQSTSAAAVAAGGSQPQDGAGASSGGSSSRSLGLSMESFVQHLSVAAPNLPVVHVRSSSYGSTSSSSTVGGGCIWVHAGVLVEVLQQLLQYAAGQQQQQTSAAVAEGK